MKNILEPLGVEINGMCDATHKYSNCFEAILTNLKNQQTNL